MNQRIRLLAEQSDATVLGTISGGRQYTFLEQDLKKFTQLIVQECARVAKATACPYHGNELTPQNAHTWDMASLESGKGILNHFGVEL